MEQLTIIVVKNPFAKTDRDIIPISHQSNTTALDLRNKYFPIDVKAVVSINGKVVPDMDLARTYPLNGDEIVMAPAIEYGVWETLFAIYATIYCAVVLAYQAGWLIPILLMVGGLVVNLLLAPDKPKLPTLDSADNSQAYSWSPQTTQQPGLPIPKIYGSMRLYGNIISAYLSSDGSKQYNNALIGLGMGPVKRLSDFKINDQDIAAFQGIEVYARNGLLNQDVTIPFDDTKTEYSLSVKVVNGTPYTYTTIGQAFDKLEAEVTFPNGLWFMSDSGSLAALSVRLSIGIRIKGTEAWTYLTQTPGILRESAGGYWSLGRWISGNDPETGDVWTVWHDVNDEVNGDGGGYSYERSSNPYAHNEGDYEGFSSCFWRWIGDPIRYVAITYPYEDITGAQTGVLRKCWSSEKLASGRYEIKVENMSADQTSTRYGDDCYLSAVREVIYDDLQYPRLALVAIKALATDQLSGSLRFSCLVEGAYVRFWTGTQWKYDASDNPAWCCWDAFTKPVIDAVKSDALIDGYEYFNEETGMSFRVLRYDGMDPSRLDLVKFKEWADYCDDLVPDGSGGTEKRITFNAIFDTASSMWEAAMTICSTGRAIPVWNGSHITVAVDKPGTPVQLFSVGNIGTDSFKETFLKMSDRASSIVIDFVNREKDYQRDTFTVQVPEIPGDNQSSISAIGITKPSEAWRAGMYRLYNNKYITRTVEIDVSLDSVACTIGDIINVQHDVPKWGVAGGRLVGASSNTITLDREVLLESNKSYTVLIRLQDDTLVSRTIINTAGYYTQLTLSSPFSVLPQQYDLYAFGETEKVVKPFRVMDISRKQDLDATISAVEYNESIYGADSGIPVLPTQNYSALDVFPPVTELALDEILISRQDGGIEDAIDVFFRLPLSEHYKQAEIWFNTGGGWLYSGSTPSNKYRIHGVPTGVLVTVAVVTINSLNDKAKIQNSPQASITTLGKLDPPSDVTNFQATQNGQFVNFSWPHIEDADLWGYEIRQGATWEGSRIIATGISANMFSWQAELNGPYRFLIKAIDTSGIYSRSAAVFDGSLHYIDENLNIVLSQDEITKTGGPDGSKTNFVFVNGTTKYLTMPHMLLDTDVPSWTDQTAEISSYSGDVNLAAEYISLLMDTFQVGDTWCRILATIDAYDQGATDQSYPTRTDQDYPGDTDQHITMPSNYAVYLCYSNDNISYTPWERYFGTVQKNFRYVKVRFTVDISSATGVFKLLNLLASFDVPDIELFIPNVAIAAGTGSDVLFSSFSGHFYTTPFITPIVIGGTINKTPVISNKSNSGCHIDLRDKTDASIAGTVDLRVTGY